MKLTDWENTWQKKEEENIGNAIEVKKRGGHNYLFTLVINLTNLGGPITSLIRFTSIAPVCYCTPNPIHFLSSSRLSYSDPSPPGSLGLRRWSGGEMWRCVSRGLRASRRSFSHDSPRSPVSRLFSTASVRFCLLLLPSHSVRLSAVASREVSWSLVML